MLSDPEKRKKYDQYGDGWEHAEQYAEAARQQQQQQQRSGFKFTQAPGGGEHLLLKKAIWRACSGIYLGGGWGVSAARAAGASAVRTLNPRLN